MTAARFTLIWPDGSITTGDTWTDLEAAMRAAQWSTYPHRWAFRRAMARRAGIWTGGRVAVLGTAKTFIHTLAAAGMFSIVTDGGDSESTIEGA